MGWDMFDEPGLMGGSESGGRNSDDCHSTEDTKDLRETHPEEYPSFESLPSVFFVSS
jgi:hypothetical protein